MAERFCDNPHCRLHGVDADQEPLQAGKDGDPHRVRRMLYRQHATGPARHYCEECYQAILAGGLTPD
jgi:hypothetical protein